MFIGRDPGEQEDLQGIPFVGPSGQLLNKLLESCGIDRSKIYISNITKCCPENNRVPTDEEKAACRDYLEEEISLVKPKIIVTLGKDALQAITGETEVTKLAGTILKSEKYSCDVIPMFHPSFILRRMDLFPHAEIHFKNLTEHINKKEKIQALTKYIYLTEFERLPSFFDKLAKQTLVSFDLETSSVNFLHGTILCVSFSWKEYTGIVLPLVGYKEQTIWTSEQYQYIVKKLREIFALPTINWIGHNISFDHKFIKKLGVEIEGELNDTMLLQTLVDENNKELKKLKALANLYTDMGRYDADVEKYKEQLSSEITKEWSARKKEIKVKIEECGKQLESLFDASSERDMLQTEIDSLNIQLEQLEENKPDISYANIPTDILWPYAAKDADATFRLYHILLEKLQKESDEKAAPYNKSLVKLYRKLVVPLRKVLDDMEATGISLDLPYLKELDKIYSGKKLDILKQIAQAPEIIKVEDILTKDAKNKIKDKYQKLKKCKLTEQEYIKKYVKHCAFNMNSNPQLGILLYSVLKLPKIKFGKTKKDGTTSASTDKEVLDYHANSNPIIKLLMGHRNIQKMHSTYIIGMQEKVDSDNRIHTIFTQHITVTGRLSSHNPNLQNIPRKNKDIKKAFLPRLGWSLLQADLAQAEFRMWAELSQDPLMIQDIRNGLDIHRATASRFWNIPLSIVTDDQRQIAKRSVFSVMYGQGARATSKQLGITENDATNITKQFFAKYPTAARWLEQTKHMVKTQGYVISPFGRIRRLPDAFSPINELKQGAMRMGVNSPIQAGAADVTAMGLIRLYKRLKEQNLQSKLVLTVHDSIALECPDNELIQVAKLCHECLTTPVAGITVPFAVDIEVGKNWGELVKWDLNNLESDYAKYKQNQTTKTNIASVNEAQIFNHAVS
jgi:DNA polymerase-1